MPTKIRQKSKTDKPLFPDGRREGFVEDHLAVAWLERGIIEIIGGELKGEPLKPKTVEDPQADPRDAVKTRAVDKGSTRKK